MTTNLLIEDIDPAIIPEKFKNPETGAIRLDALVNSYAELEKKMSAGPAAPKSPEEYCVNCDHGLFEPDGEVNRRLHAKGMTQEQVQEVYDLAAEKMMPMIKTVATDFSADREVEKLVNHFGGPEAWKEVSRQLLAFGQRNIPADVLENLSSSYEGVLALYKMMKSEEPGLKKQSENPSALGEQDLQSMMRDPKYWRDKDPAYVARVTEGFKNMYGE
ncbi:MAG: hypothetical protein H6860_04225 [Rhodospirillales bacterium]|nr:hypothetical protein [Alphaproteobacteria bacterium]MCB9981586.1 hypothetical protein [Rhodospirillales bacterium]